MFENIASTKYGQRFVSSNSIPAHPYQKEKDRENGKYGKSALLVFKGIEIHKPLFDHQAVVGKLHIVRQQPRIALVQNVVVQVGKKRTFGFQVFDDRESFVQA